MEDHVDDRTFRLDFSVDGVLKLRDRVKDKLKEFMGEYTDDTLVEYVIVLLRNGRRKDEAKIELDVFLGEDSESFVAWLWDHLASHVDQYLQSADGDEVPRAKSASLEQPVKSLRDAAADLDSEKMKSDKVSKSRHRREWRGPVNDVAQFPSLRSSWMDEVQEEIKSERKSGRTRRSVSPGPSGQRKRRHPDDRQPPKREVVARAMAAPTRLLQFAVRDAVATLRPSNSLSEPAVKRLRSVVSTSAVDSASEVQPRRLQSVARMPSAVTTAIKAVAEAAEDVRRVKPAGNVFDRLSQVSDVLESTGQTSPFKKPAINGTVYEDYEQNQEGTARQVHLQRSVYGGHYEESRTLMESDTEMAFDSASDNEGYDDFNVMSHRFPDVLQTGTAGTKKSEADPMMVQCCVSPTAEVRQPAQIMDQEQPVMANTSQKIVNISVNVNTWKPPHYQPPREIHEVKSQKPEQQSEVAAGKSGVQFTRENGDPLKGNVKPAANMPNKTQRSAPSVPGPYSTGRPVEDADSRTIFVSNVHFAATKDSLSRHFNKFGEVLKVIILTDAATGQPKGSAYVEFMRKDAAENALSLNGTSFMSRILKVARKSNAHHDATTPIMTWPRVARGAPFAVPRFARAPFPRVFPGAYRARPTIKPGARSMQWKRGSLPTPADKAALTSSGSNLSSAARGFTYVRTEMKADGNA